MFELKIKHISIVFDFSFFATMSILMLYGDNKYILLGFITCLWHELGHLAAMLINGINIKKIFFYGAGIKIIPDKSFAFTPIKAQFIVLSAGCVINFITFILFYSSSNTILRIFADLNAAIGAFNLLPLQFLDGGKIIILCIYKLCQFNNAVVMERYLKWLNVIWIIISLLFFLIIGKGNITLFVTLCYLLISTLSY